VIKTYRLIGIVALSSPFRSPIFARLHCDKAYRLTGIVRQPNTGQRKCVHAIAATRLDPSNDGRLRSIYASNGPAWSFNSLIGDQQMSLALDVAQVMVETGLGRSTVFLAIKDGKLKAKKAGRKTLILRSELIRFLETLPDRATGGTV
jgi:excisionase family DNA binding protein